MHLRTSLTLITCELPLIAACHMQTEHEIEECLQTPIEQRILLAKTDLKEKGNFVLAAEKLS